MRYIPLGAAFFRDVNDQGVNVSGMDLLNYMALDPFPSVEGSQYPPGASTPSAQSFKLAGRSNLELENTARNHPLYHNVAPHADGHYHCPWENKPEANCKHKPEKLKCNYEYDGVFFLPFSSHNR
jgi:hypothetical protein